MKLFELDTETLVKAERETLMFPSGDWYSFQFELPTDQLAKEDAALVAERVASMADGVLTHFDYVESPDTYEVVIYFESENKAHNALKTLRRVARGKPRFDFEGPTIDREEHVWGNIIEPMLESQELFEKFKPYTRKELVDALNYHIESETEWYDQMGIETRPPGYPIKLSAISKAMLNVFNNDIGEAEYQMEGGDMSEDALEEERYGMYIQLVDQILDMDFRAHVDRLDRRFQVARRRQGK